MIIDKLVRVLPRNNCKRWSEILGYSVGYHDILDVPIELVPKNSNKEVDVICDECSSKFKRSLQLLNKTPIHLCYKCSKKDIGNKNSIIQGGVKRPWQMGDKHPRWTGRSKEFIVYSNRVHAITKSTKLKRVWSTWENADKIGMCGVEGAYQLDHKVSIKYGFYNNIPAEIIASLANLEIITWESNRNKSGNCTIDLWDLLS